MYPWIKGSFAPPKFDPWGLSDASICLRMYRVQHRWLRGERNREQKDHWCVSGNFTLPVLKDEIHVDALGIISKTSCNLTNMSYRLQNTYWIQMSSVKLPCRCLWILKIDSQKLCLKKRSFHISLHRGKNRCTKSDKRQLYVCIGIQAACRGQYTSGREHDHDPGPDLVPLISRYALRLNE